MEQYLDEKLIAYSHSDIYPFHMPGHKRQHLGDWTPEEIDITEIDGFDNLHHAEGILRDGQRRLAKLCGADESFYLVNGSTCGLLAVICGVTKKGDRILMARNCHKAVYHAAYLMELKAEYLYPLPTAFGIQGSMNSAEVWEKLETFSDVAAVVITSPTYDGVVSDIEGIARAAHAHGIPLIVDEAHGAHFGFSKGFPKKAIALGADLCIESFHKTLPSFTQTAVLHAMKTEDGAYRFDMDAVKRYLGIFQTSSPSYVFLAGMDRCVRILEEDRQLYGRIEPFENKISGGTDKIRELDERETSETGSDSTSDGCKIACTDSLFWKFEGRLRRFYEASAKLKRVQVFPDLGNTGTDFLDLSSTGTDVFKNGMSALNAGEDADNVKNNDCQRIKKGIWAKDKSKILISASALGWSGQQLSDVLLGTYHLQMEMASGHYVTALTSVMDTDEGFLRLSAALWEIDEHAKNQPTIKTDCHKITPLDFYCPQKKILELVEAVNAPKETCRLENAVGRVSGEFIYLYPPGIPMIVPGELLSREMTEVVGHCGRLGLKVQGLKDFSGETVQCVSKDL